uniref:Uncharacterized protein n=1 Tax=Anguilla anguilla TaxID=7936 RepID=A0A0E9PDA3_ANGAN
MSSSYFISEVAEQHLPRSTWTGSLWSSG